MKPAGSRAVVLTLAGVVFLGAILRLNEYLGNRPLWIDELMLALNIGRRSFAGLLTSLDYEQTAPLLFLWSVKATTVFAGMNEYALRAIPLVAGVLLPWMTWRMARALAGTATGLIAAALAAVAVPLIYYSAEVKPYGTDALVGAALLLLALRTRVAPDRTATWWHLVVAGLLGLLAALPAPFLLAGGIAALLGDPRIRAEAALRKRLALLTVVWSLAIIILYATVYRAGAANPYLRRFWEGTFLIPGSGDFSARLYAFGTALAFPLTPLPGGLPLRWSLALLAVGLLLLARRAGLSGALLVGVPFVAVAGASALARYAIGGRLLLVLAPGLFVLVAAPLAELLRLARAGEARAGGIGVLLVLAAAAPKLVANGRAPIVREGGRDAARLIVRSAADPVYVLASSLPAWAYYSTSWDRPDYARLDRYARLARGSGPSAPNDLLPVHGSDSAAASRTAVSAGRLELIGFRSGLSYREPAGITRASSPADWAPREADRIAQAAQPSLWIYGAHWVQRELPALREELYRRGFSAIPLQQETAGVALRVRAGRSGPR